MALIEVIKYEGNTSEFVWKFPSVDLKLGAQLIVNHSQSAFFVRMEPFAMSFKKVDIL